MRAALLYGSTHGKTKRVVAEVTGRLRISPDVFNVKESICMAALAQYDLLLFFCPNYGDQELQQDMELFLRAFELNLAGKLFVVCELGSYYGYDDFHFGALCIIRQHLLNLKGHELCEPLSLDTFPRTNWDHLQHWVEVLNRRIAEHDGH